jgi:uncharacterized protein
VNAADEMTREDETSSGRERRCIVTGETLPDAERVRFVVGPDSAIYPDIEETLPGRGIWVKAERAAVEKAVAKNLFSRAAKAEVKADAGLADLVERLLIRRMTGDLGLARKSGALVFGFDNVARALSEKRPPAALIEASDGSDDGRRKLRNAALNQGLNPHFIYTLSSAELALALGRENVIHAAVKPGRLAERLILEAARLEGFRPAERQGVGRKAAKKGQE